jgi:replication factor A1
MKSEMYINKIIEATGLQRKEIQELVEEKKSELRGLISDEGALFIIAKELGLDIKEENNKILEDIDIKISDIVPNMKNITLIGRIKEIFDIYTFNREDNSQGKVGSFILTDDTGDIRITLWDDKVDIIQDPNFQINELIKIINGYAKVGKYNKTEIHLGKLGKIILGPSDVDYNKYPKIDSNPIEIREIGENMYSVIIEGQIMNKYPVKCFEKKNGELGKVGSILARDRSGIIRITFWDDDTKKLDNLNVGDAIKITNLKPKKSNLDPNKIDLFISPHSNIVKLKSNLDIKEQKVNNIAQLQKIQKVVSVQGVITSIDNLKEISSRSGENLSLLAFTVSDDTDWIRVTLWRETAEKYAQILKMGDGILLKNIMVKYNTFSQRNEISFIKISNIEKLDLHIDNLKIPETSLQGVIKSSFIEDYTKISSINSADYFKIKGFIAKEIKNNDIIIYDACSKCRRKIENCECTEEQEIEKSIILKLTIDDGSSGIKTTFFGKNAENLIGLKAKDISTIVDFDNFLENLSKALMGRDLIIEGRSVFNDYNEINRYELNVNNFKDIDITEELEKEMQELENL